eukprot:gene16749-22269_t
MADRVAADLAADIAAHAGLMNELRRQQQVAASQPTQLNYHAGAGSSIQPTHITKEEVTANNLASIDVPGPGGLSPLALACIQGNMEDVDLLLKCGADPAAECDVFDTTDEDE